MLNEKKPEEVIEPEPAKNNVEEDVGTETVETDVEETLEDKAADEVKEETEIVIDTEKTAAEKAARTAEANRARNLEKFHIQQLKKETERLEQELAWQQRHMTQKQKDEMKKQIAAEKKASEKAKIEAKRAADRHLIEMDRNAQLSRAALYKAENEFAALSNNADEEKLDAAEKALEALKKQNKKNELAYELAVNAVEKATRSLNQKN